jgi:hypothetical protein
VIGVAAAHTDLHAILVNGTAGNALVVATFWLINYPAITGSKQAVINIEVSFTTKISRWLAMFISCLNVAK